jgi:LysR family transcriptional regulator, glycine cleavage system transcriptional activator
MPPKPNPTPSKPRGAYNPRRPTPPAPTQPPTTRMPALTTLRAFEAVVRLGSVQQAAQELHVTPGAVSQQVKALEADLGVQLVGRRGNTLTFTEHALRGRDQLSAGLRMLQQGVERMRHRPQVQRIRLTVEPAFAANWLIRRLPAYRALPGAQDVVLDPAKAVVDIAGGEADLGIRFGQGRYPGLEAINLFEDEIYPVCSPDYLKRHPITNLDDLKHHHLLRLDWRATGPWPDWAEWLHAAGLIDADNAPRDGTVLDDTGNTEQRGTILGDTSLLLRAALEGQGLALGQASLVSDLIKDKKLVAPVARRMKTGFGYYLVFSHGADERPEIKVFKDWIVREAKKE